RLIMDASKDDGKQDEIIGVMSLGLLNFAHANGANPATVLGKITQVAGQFYAENSTDTAVVTKGISAIGKLSIAAIKSQSSDQAILLNAVGKLATALTETTLGDAVQAEAIAGATDGILATLGD